MLEKAIASKEYRKFIQENNIQLSDWDFATLIYNNIELTYFERQGALEELMHATDDKELANQINERIIRDKNYIDEVREDSENAYYILTIGREDNYAIDGIYKSYEKALYDGLMEGEEFSITKRCFDCKRWEEERTGIYGTISFSPGGSIVNYRGLYGINKEDDIDDHGTDRFEGRSLNLPLFFRTGDIVKIIGTNMYGIVDAPDNDEEEVRMQKFAELGDYSDFQVPVNTVFDGDNYLTIFAHEHVAPSMLEYATFEEGDKRSGFLEYLVKKIYQSPWFGGPGRDKARIPEVLSRVETIWKQYPDLRLGQLLLNVCGTIDLFSIEDEELVRCLDDNKWGR